VFERFKRLFRRTPAMIGTPPSARPMWHDPAAHARDFAARYADPINYHVENRMMELGIPTGRIGFPDPDAGNRWAAFHPGGGEGGNNSPDGRLIVDSGLFYPDLLKKDYGEAAAELYADSDVTSRLDSIIAHEYEEHRYSGSHVEALKHAPKTELPIGERAREIGEAMRKGWKGR